MKFFDVESSALAWIIDFSSQLREDVFAGLGSRVAAASASPLVS